MFCGKCGAPIDEGANVCASCGEAVVVAAQPVAEEPVVQAEPVQEQAQPVYQQPVYQQPVYQQPVYQQPVIPEGYSETVSIGEWIGSMFLMMIPVVNFILVLVWAFGGSKKSKSNFFKAYLILVLIGVVIGVLIGVFFGAALFEEFMYY